MSTQTRNLTDEQRSAITTTEVSVGLSAGAGCGKTFVLTERFLANLGPESGRDPLRRIVAITFTEAAAREMRNRIRAACRERLVTANEEDVEHWLGILRGLDSARITTIHGFCGSVLRRYAVEANIDPQFQQLDKTSGDAFVRRLVSDRSRQVLAAIS